MSHEEAMEILRGGMGNHFDPDIVNCVIGLEATFRNIAMTAADFDTNIGTLKEFGISGLILKPIDFNRLATLYTEALRNRHGRLKPKA